MQNKLPCMICLTKVAKFVHTSPVTELSCRSVLVSKDTCPHSVGGTEDPICFVLKMRQDMIYTRSHKCF